MAGLLRARLKPGGTMVLTFVNKWYFVDILLHVLRFRFRKVFRRFRKNWGGYSDAHHLDSHCFSPREIQQAFGADFTITRRRGYSILYPAWFRANWISRLGRRMGDVLWDADRMLNHTPAWCLGEYALYTFKTRD
jgi:hypothetical protein